VFLPDELVTMIAQHAEHIGTRGDEQWLFVGPTGEPPHQNTVGYWWRKTIAAAGLPHFRLHDLRHFYASGHRRGLRRRDRSACPRSCQGDDDPLDVLAPMADS
jgi:integrase